MSPSIHVCESVFTENVQLSTKERMPGFAESPCRALAWLQVCLWCTSTLVVVHWCEHDLANINPKYLIKVLPGLCRGRFYKDTKPIPRTTHHNSHSDTII